VQALSHLGVVIPSKGSILSVRTATTRTLKTTVDGVQDIPESSVFVLAPNARLPEPVGSSPGEVFAVGHTVGIVDQTLIAEKILGAITVVVDPRQLDVATAVEVFARWLSSISVSIWTVDVVGILGAFPLGFELQSHGFPDDGGQEQGKLCLGGNQPLAGHLHG